MAKMTRLVFTFCLLMVKTAIGSHVYASIEEIRKTYNKLNLPIIEQDLQDPVQCFLAMKELFSNKLLQNNDVLGAVAGLAKIKNRLTNYSVLAFDDRKLVEKVEIIMEEMDLENKSAIDYKLEDICNESTYVKMRESNFTCYIDFKNHFLKKEILSENPEIYIVYEVYNDRDITNILREAHKKHLMHMFEIYEDYLGDLEVEIKQNNYEYAGMNFTENDFLKLAQSLHFGREGKLYFPEIGSNENMLIDSKLIRYGLIPVVENKTTANLQISTYGIGGYLTPHYDTYRQPGEGKIEEGEEWMGTIMGYLTSIESGQGGETVFPRLGLSVRPVAGSVLVWSNIDAGSGEVLLESLHAGCPVVRGEKWVFNKWVLQ